MNKKKIISLVVGVVFILISFISILVLDIPTIKREIVSFTSSYNEKEVTLKGTYYDVKDSEYAVLICPGYSCDRQKWRPFANLFVKNSYSTMMFDYSGQGGSSYTIGFDNAKTDNISKEIDDAIVKLHELSNVDYDHIILVGHSMGGRSILRLLYDYNDPNAETLVTKKDIKNVILLSPEVNYNYNAQASLFAGTSDSEQIPWKDYNESCIQGTNVFLFGSYADDIVSDEDILAIYDRLGGTINPSEKNKMFSETNSLGSTLSVALMTGVLHSYQMYSYKFAKVVNQALEMISSSSMNYNPYNMLLVYSGWMFGLIGLGILLFGLNEGKEWIPTDNIPSLTNPKQFLIRKSILWLLGIVFAFLVCSLCVVMPFGSPVMNIPYMCFIAGYGIVMVIFYSKGKFKGTEGKLPKPSFKIKFNNAKDLIISIIITISLCFFVWFVLNGTMYKLIPLNFRLFWVIFASVLMGIGYYVSGVETDMLNNSNASKLVKFLYNVIQYVPLFLLVLFYLILKSYSGLIGQVQNLLLMYLFSIPIGNYIKKKTNNRIIGAVLTAFIFQTIMITSAALISLF